MLIVYPYPYIKVSGFVNVYRRISLTSVPIWFSFTWYIASHMYFYLFLFKTKIKSGRFTPPPSPPKGPLEASRGRTAGLWYRYLSIYLAIIYSSFNNNRPKNLKLSTTENYNKILSSKDFSVLGNSCQVDYKQLRVGFGYFPCLLHPPLWSNLVIGNKWHGRRKGEINSSPIVLSLMYM